MFSIIPTELPEVLLVTVPVYRDDRGWFQEIWHRAKHTAPVGDAATKPAG